MKHFVYFSASGPTSGKFDSNLMKAGRMDIAIHSLIQSLFLSHSFRDDVVFHLIFYGMPDPPKHIEIQIKDETIISKKDIGKLISKILYKYKEGEKNEIFPGCFIEKRSFLKVIGDLEEKGNEIFVLDGKGEDIREADIPDKCVFVLGDHKGMPSKEFKRLKKEATLVSVGPKTYFASQTVAIVNNELDRRFG